MTFSNTNLDTKLLQGIEDAGYVDCTPVQEQVLAAGLDGSDLYVQSQTGTGKTAAYLITMMQRMLSAESGKRRPALILVPTRELAVQVEEEAQLLGKHTGIEAFSFYGGVGYQKQEEALKQGVDLIIGTPGRVIDLEKSGTMCLKNIGFLVIDEADRMFDMGFYPDLRSLLSVLPDAEQRQTMLFSATLNTWVKNLAWEYTIHAKEITIDADSVTVDEIKQQLFHVGAEQKMSLLLGILAKERPENSIIFCNMKKTAEIVAKRLQINGYPADFLIGDLPQPKRLQLIDSFKAGTISCLVATDVAARGIDINDLAMVINYDLPNEAENYVHRIGRTARAGKTGTAYSLCSEQDVYALPEIEKYIESKVPAVIPGEDDFQEDRSAGCYIRLDRDEERDNRFEGRQGRRNRAGDTAGRDSRGGRSAGKPGKTPRQIEGSGRIRKKTAKMEDKAGRKTPNSLENLSFEERMAYYKNQYGKNLTADSTAPGGAQQSKPKNTAGKPKNRKGQTSEKRRKGEKYAVSRPDDGTARIASKKRQQKSARQKQPVRETAAAPQPKRGLFSALKKLFFG
ncbi:MAG: DEAD/DEAH box helicase [Treponema sp.]